jgi:hypothetical protein
MNVEQLSPNDLPNYYWGRPGSYQKSEYACHEAMRHLCGAFTATREHEDHFPYIGLMTLTFSSQLESCKEAKKILDKILKTLKRRYPEELYRAGHRFSYVWCQERHQSGGIHFHIAMEMPFNTREGTDIETLRGWDDIPQRAFMRDRIKDSIPFLNKALQEENRQLSGVLSEYGVGRYELWPILSDANSISDYISKGIARHVLHRDPKDKGARLWGCSDNIRVVKTKLTFLNEKATTFRRKLEAWATPYGCKDYGDLKSVFGPRWYLNNRQFIHNIELGAGGDT